MIRLTFLAALLAALTIGCGDKQSDTEKTMKTAPGGVDVESNVESAIDKAMAGLSEADQKLARAQKTCPVSDEALGGMGTPIKVEVKGKTVFLCCKSCVDDIKSDPDKYLAKLK